MTAQPHDIDTTPTADDAGEGAALTAGVLRLDPEATLLCAMMFSRDADELALVAEHLSAEDFINPRFGELFTALTELIAAGEGHEPTRVLAHLHNVGELAGHKGKLRADALQAISLLDTPALGLQGRALDVLRATYRRAYRAAAQRQLQAADEAATDHLFDIILDAGTQMRTYTRRLDALARA